MLIPSNIYTISYADKSAKNIFGGRNSGRLMPPTFDVTTPTKSLNGVRPCVIEHRSPIIPTAEKTPDPLEAAIINVHMQYLCSVHIFGVHHFIGQRSLCRSNREKTV